MTYGAFLTGHPLFWSSLVGAACGIAIATLTRSTRHDRRPGRSRSRKWSSGILWVTAGVIAATFGVFLPEGNSFFAPASLYVGGGALVFFAAALRFPRACGIPAFFILAALSVLSPLVMRSYVPVRGSTPVAAIQVLAVDDSTTFLEVDNFTPGSSGAPEVVRIAGPDPVVRAHILRISDYLFFLGATEGIALGEIGSLQILGAADIYSATPFVGAIADWLPLLSRNTVETDPVTLELLKVYEIVGESRLGVRVQMRDSSRDQPDGAAE